MIASSRFAFALLLGAALPVFAQIKAPAKVPGGITISAEVTLARPNGVRLEGNPSKPVRLTSPELDLMAQVVALDFDTTKGKTISEVRAQNSVSLKMNLTPKNGGAPARIEVRCANATLTPRPFKLVLKGKLNGFYQVTGGAKNTISGDTATFTQVNNNLIADVTGGITVNIPAETLGRPDDLGDLTITAQRGRINQADGSATFSGNARATSKGGSNGFDVTATEFVLTREPNGTISTLKTVGRTLVKLDLPPDPAPQPVAGATLDKPGVGKPTHLEVAADSATINRSTSTAIFNGNVKGFYTLNPAAQGPQSYNFAGDIATISYAPSPATGATGNALAGLSVQVKGEPVSIEGPAFDFGF
jgi:hypothetical protein